MAMEHEAKQKRTPPQSPPTPPYQQRPPIYQSVVSCMLEPFLAKPNKTMQHNLKITIFLLNFRHFENVFSPKTF